MKRTSSWTVRSSSTSSAPRSRKKLTRPSTSSSGALAPEVMPTVSTPSSQSSLDLGVVVDQVRGGAVFAGDLDQAVGVRGVGRADHQDQVALARQLLHRDLAVGRRVTDVVGLAGDDRRELGPQRGDHLGGLVDRERRLGDEGDLVGVGHLERLDLGDGFDQHDRLGRLAGRPFDLLVALVADHHDRVALGGETAGRDVDLRHQRAGRVDRPQAALGGVLVDRRSDAVGGEDDDRALRHLGLLVDEDRASLRPVPRPRACCGRSPCGRRRGRRGPRARARPSARRGRHRRSSRAGRRGGLFRGGGGGCCHSCRVASLFA